MPKTFALITDLRRLLLAFPDLTTEDGDLSERLRVVGAPAATLEAWRDIVRSVIEPDENETDDD